MGNNFSCTNRLVKPTINENNKYILGIIDPQNDFFQSGSLPVSNSNEILGPINKLRHILKDDIETFISMDSHPINHISFASTHNAEQFSKINLKVLMNDNKLISIEQTLWPVHCVINSSGHQVHKNLIRSKNDIIIKKGTVEKVESYSAFGDELNNKYENTGLHGILTRKKITDIILVGLATDYCVYFTALDAIKYGYNVHLILSCVRGVDPSTTQKAIDDLREKKIKIYPEVDDFLHINTL